MSRILPELQHHLNRKIISLNYLSCLQPQHQNQDLSIICLNNQCKDKKLICLFCQQKNHQSHNTIPLKDYLIFIHQQRAQTNPFKKLQLHKSLYSFVNQNPKNQKFNFLYYIKQIQLQKTHCKSIINQIKTKIINQMQEIEYQLEINARKYIERCEQMINQHRFQRNIINEINQILQKNDRNKFNLMLEGLRRNYYRPNNQMFEINQDIMQNNKQSQIINFIPLNERLKSIQQAFHFKVITLEKSLNQMNLKKKIESQNIVFEQKFSYDCSSKLYDWDPSLKSIFFNIRPQKPKNIYSTTSTTDKQRFALMKVSFKSNMKKITKWAIKIHKLAGWIGVGLCLKKQILDCQFKFNSGKQGHGAYLISFNCYSWSHSQFSKNAQCLAFNFHTGDIIIMEYDPIKLQLMFKKYKKQDSKFILKIAPLKQDQQLCPCVNMCSINDQVQIIPIPQ